MHDSIFIASQGSNIILDLGALEELKERLLNVVHWNVAGNASLILFFKLLGYNYNQTFNKLINFNLLNNSINGSSLMPENDKERITFVRGWLEDVIKENKLFTKNINLENIYKQTNIFPCFIVWSRTKKEIINVNPDTYPEMGLIDIVMASLTALGLYNDYYIDGNQYTNIFSVDSYPCIYSYNFLADSSNYFFVSNIITNNNRKEYNLGPMQDKENELLNQFCDHNNFRINNLSKTFEESQMIKLYSNLLRGECSYEAMNGLYRSGKLQGKAFLDNRDTKQEYASYIDQINLQS